MLNVLKQWFGRWLRWGSAQSPTTQTQENERLLVLEQQLQNLRLELAERNQLVDKLKQELERQRHSESFCFTKATFLLPYYHSSLQKRTM